MSELRVNCRRVKLGSSRGPAFIQDDPNVYFRHHRLARTSPSEVIIKKTTLSDHKDLNVGHPVSRRNQSSCRGVSNLKCPARVSRPPTKISMSSGFCPLVSTCLRFQAKQINVLHRTFSSDSATCRKEENNDNFTCWPARGYAHTTSQCGQAGGSGASPRRRVTCVLYTNVTG